MVKAWCIWCECGNGYPPMYKNNGMVWIHEKCFFEISDMKSSLETIDKILKQEHPRRTSVDKFLEDMEDFRRRWDNTERLIKKWRSGGG